VVLIFCICCTGWEERWCWSTGTGMLMGVTHLGRQPGTATCRVFCIVFPNFLPYRSCVMWVFEIGFRIPCVNWRLEKCLISEMVMPQQMLWTMWYIGVYVYDGLTHFCPCRHLCAMWLSSMTSICSMSVNASWIIPYFTRSARYLHAYIFQGTSSCYVELLKFALYSSEH
jgi:hypothetical protein